MVLCVQIPGSRGRVLKDKELTFFANLLILNILCGVIDDVFNNVYI